MNAWGGPPGPYGQPGQPAGPPPQQAPPQVGAPAPAGQQHQQALGEQPSQAVDIAWAHRYVQAIGHNFAGCGLQVGPSQVGPLQALVGQGKINPAGTLGMPVKLFVVAAVVEEVSLFVVRDFSQHAEGMAKQAKSAMGSVGTIVGLVSPRVAPEVTQRVAAVQGWGTILLPLVVDISSGHVQLPASGPPGAVMVYGELDGRARQCFPPPAQVLR